MKKIITGIASLFFIIAIVQTMPFSELLAAQNSKSVSSKNNTKQKLHNLRGIIKSIDPQGKRIIMEYGKKENRMMISFSYAGASIKDGKKDIDISVLKVGDKIMLLYKGDINNNPEIKKVSLIKEKTKKSAKK
jgi:hypothetical protein